MDRIAWRFATAGLLMAFSAPTQTVPQLERALSKAESSIVARQIATLKLPGERGMAAGWSDAKKMEEMICRLAALSVLQKQNKGVDRVFLERTTRPACFATSFPTSQANLERTATYLIKQQVLVDC